MKRKNGGQRTATRERISDQREAIESETWQTRDITTRTILTRAGTVNESERSVEAVIATENPAIVFDWRTFSTIDEILVARGHGALDHTPLLESHNRWNLDAVFGSVDKIRLDGAVVAGRLKFADVEETADPIERAWKKVKQGHIRGVSVGYSADKYVDIPPGQSQAIEGRSYKADKRTLRITTKWTIREVSLVAIGADDHALIRELVARQFAQRSTYTMNPELRAYLESCGLSSAASEADALRFLSNLDEERRARADAIRGGTPANNATPANPGTRTPEPDPEPTPASRTAPAGNPTPTNQPANPGTRTPEPAEDRDAETRRIATEAAQREATRQDSIRRLDRTGEHSDLIERALRENWSRDRAAAAMYERLTDSREPAVRTFGIGRGNPTEGPEMQAALAAGVAMRAGLDPVTDFIAANPDATPAERQALERAAESGRQFRHSTLLELSRLAIRLDGIEVPTNREELAHRAASSATLTALATQSVSARMVRSYAEARDTTEPWTIRTDVMDYKQSDRFRLGAMPGLSPQPEAAVADMATINDESESYKIARFSRQWIMDAIAIINDSIDALTRIPTQFGRAAARLVPDSVYAHLLANGALSDTIALFHASHNNLLTGAGSALTATPSGLKAAIALMGKQTISVEDETVILNVAPRYLITPVDTSHDARQQLRSIRIREDSGKGEDNVFATYGIDPIEENRIGAAGVTDPLTGMHYSGSATQWYLIADPSEVDTIEVGFLMGTNRRPTVRSWVENARGKFGIGFDISHSVGVKALSHVGMQRNAGA